MNISVCVHRSLIALVALALPYGALAAEESIDRWIAQSSVLLDKHVSYPYQAYHRPTGLSYLRVTINGNGEVIKSEIIGKSGSRILDRASLRTIKKIKQFPAIPALARFGDEMTFGVKLRYYIALPSQGFMTKTRKPKVTTKEMAIVIFDTGN